MRKRFFYSGVVAAVGAWVIYPGLPAPDEVVGKTLGDVVFMHGKPTAELPDKFVEWRSPRLVGEWYLDVGANFPLTMNQPVTNATRGFSIAGVVLFRTSAP